MTDFVSMNWILSKVQLDKKKCLARVSMCKKPNYILGSVIKIFLAGQESQTRRIASTHGTGLQFCKKRIT